MPDPGYFTKLRAFLSGKRPRRVRRGQCRPVSGESRTACDNAFSLEPLEPRVLLAADLAGAVQAVQVVDPVVPQQNATATILMTNQGQDTAKDKVDVKVYASQDQTFEATDVLLGTAQSKGNLKAGNSETLNVSLTFPSTLAPGSASLLVVVDAGNKIAESNEANNVAVGPSVNVAWQFGAVSGRTGNTNLTLRDADGTNVTFSLVGGGTGEVIRDGSEWDVRLTGTTPQSVFTILGQGGNNRVSIDDIHVQRPLGALVAPTMDMDANHTLTIDGPVTAGLLLGNITDTAITLPSIQGTTIQGVNVQGLAIGGNLSQSTIEVSGPLGNFVVGGSMTGSTVQAGSITSVRVNGTMSADSHITAPSMPATALIGGQTIIIANDARFITNVAPVITGEGEQLTIPQGTVFGRSVSASDTAPGLTWSLVDAPAWVTLTNLAEFFGAGRYGRSARVDLAPGQDVVPGHYTITAMVTDSGTPTLTASTTFGVDVVEDNKAPVITSGGDQFAILQGGLFGRSVTAKDRAPGMTWSLVDAPAWVTLTNQTEFFDGGFYYASARLTGTPGQDVTPGHYAITAMVTDSGTPTLTASTTFGVDVVEDNVAPVITGEGEQLTIPQGTVFGRSVSASDTAPGLTWSLVDAPAWVTLTNLAEFFGAGRYGRSARVDLAPGQDVVPGHYTITAMVTDSGTPTLTASTTFEVDVVENNVAPIATPDNKTTQQNTALSFPAADLSANDTDADGNPLTITAVAATADTHGTVDLSNGTVTYTPALDFTGPASFEYTVSDGAGGTATGLVTVTVTAANQAPTILSPDDGQNVGTTPLFQNVNVRILAKDPENDTLTFTLVDGPAGSQLRGGQFFPAPGDTSFTAGTTFAWTAAAPGSYQATVRVADTSGATDTVTFFFNVNAGNQAPLVNDQTFNVPENSPSGTVVGTIAASDPDAGDTLNYTVIDGTGQSAFAVNATTGQITVANGAALDFEQTPSFGLTVQVADAGGLSDTAVVTINLTDVSEGLPPHIIPPDGFILEIPTDAQFPFVFHESIAAIDPDGNPTFPMNATATGGTLTRIGPAFDPNRWQIEFTATGYGDHTTTVTVTDASGLSTTSTITWRFVPPIL